MQPSTPDEAAILKALHQKLRQYSGSLSELAKRTKMSRQNLQHYFQGKQRLQVANIILHGSAILVEHKQKNNQALKALQEVVNAY